MKSALLAKTSLSALHLKPDGETAYADLDEEGYESVSVGGDDCDDADSDIHPGASDANRDGIDQDCDGSDGKGGVGCSSTLGFGSGFWPLFLVVLAARRRLPISVGPHLD